MMEKEGQSRTEHEESIRKILIDLGVTTEEVLERTPARWINFLQRYTEGEQREFNDFKCFNTTSDQMIIVENRFWSICEHHLLPYFGKAYVGYLPNGKVLGVSKVVRYVQHVSMKPGIQENLTEEIANTLYEEIDPRGVMVILKGFHTCVASRYDNGWMTTSALRGNFVSQNESREEFIKLITAKPDGIIE